MLKIFVRTEPWCVVQDLGNAGLWIISQHRRKRTAVLAVPNDEVTRYRVLHRDVVASMNMDMTSRLLGAIIEEHDD